MIFKNVFIAAIFWFPFFLYGQEATYNRLTEQHTFIFFQQPASSTHSNSNAILIKLASALDESPKRLKIGVAYSEILEVRLPAMKSPEVNIRFNDIHSFSSPLYRGFSMNEVLSPDLLTCNLNLIDLPDSNILRQYNLTNLSVSQLVTGYTSSDIPVVVPGKFSVTLSDITFHFSDAAFEKFRSRIQLVNDYFAAAALTDYLLEATDNYNPLSTADLPEKYILLMEVNRIVRLIRDHNFDVQLHLNGNDPEQFAGKFLKLDKFSRSATMTFVQQLADPALIDWKGSLTDLAETYILHLISYIRRSMLLNDIRGDLYKEYLDSWFLSTGFTNEKETLNDLVKKMYPSEDPTNRLHSITQTVWDAYLQGARQLIDESNYVGAITLLEHASAYKEQVPMQMEPDNKPLQGEAVKGIYASYLGIAESCINLRKFQMAEDYISHAGDYLAGYEGVIPTDTMFQRVFRKLFDQRLQGCDFILGEKQYQEALDCYQLFSLSYPPEMIAYVEDHLESREMEALKGLFFKERDQTLLFVRQRLTDSALASYDNVCRYSDLIKNDPEIQSACDELNNRILPIRYQHLADRGTYLYMTYNHEEAYKTFNRMKEVGTVLGMPLDTALERMALESYKHHMLNEISMATGMIWKNELEMAKEYVQEVESVMDLYNLDMDPDLQSALSSYRRKIDLKICLSAKEEADMLAIRAWRNIELKQFDLAVKQLGDARQKARQHPECELDLQAYDDTIKKYISAAFYLEKQQQALNQLTIGNFQAAMKLANDNDRFYLNTQLEQFGVPKVTTLDFVAQSSRVPMYIEAVTFFLQTGDVNSAWICLTWLKREDMEARDVRELQERVGNALSISDFRAFPDGDPENRVRSYTGGNRWFVKFANAYTSRWRQLQTEQLLKTP